MNVTHSFSSPVSNPSAVMQMINAAGTNLSALLRSSVEVAAERTPSRVSHLRLHIAPESEQPQSWSEPAPVASRQVQQLVQHLRQRQRELDQREADLQANVYRFEQQTTTNQAQVRRQSHQLEQQLEQFKAQQVQLVKLQQNLVDTQLTLRRVIERIIESSEPSQLKQELLSLKHELNESLDTILRRWEAIKARSRPLNR